MDLSVLHSNLDRFTYILNVPEFINRRVHSLHQRQINVGLLDEAANDIGKLHQLIASVDVAILTSHLQNIATLVTAGIYAR